MGELSECLVRETAGAGGKLLFGRWIHWSANVSMFPKAAQLLQEFGVFETHKQPGQEHLRGHSDNAQVLPLRQILGAFLQKVRVDRVDAGGDQIQNASDVGAAHRRLGKDKMTVVGNVAVRIQLDMCHHKLKLRYSIVEEGCCEPKLRPPRNMA